MTVNVRVDAVAKALREHDMAGRIIRPWKDLPNYDKKKWWAKAEVAIYVVDKVSDYKDEKVVL